MRTITAILFLTMSFSIMAKAQDMAKIEAIKQN